MAKLVYPLSQGFGFKLRKLKIITVALWAMADELLHHPNQAETQKKHCSEASSFPGGLLACLLGIQFVRSTFFVEFEGKSRTFQSFKRT